MNWIAKWKAILAYLSVYGIVFFMVMEGIKLVYDPPRSLRLLGRLGYGVPEPKAARWFHRSYAPWKTERGWGRKE